MGEVYRARDTRLNRDVAIKTLPSHALTDPRVRERFDREARVIAALSHPNILAIFDVGEDEGVVRAPIMEGCDASPGRELLREFLTSAFGLRAAEVM